MTYERKEILEAPEYFVSKPTRLTLFMRTFLPWQLIRFALINLKMLRIIKAGHSQKAR